MQMAGGVGVVKGSSGHGLLQLKNIVLSHHSFVRWPSIAATLSVRLHLARQKNTCRGRANRSSRKKNQVESPPGHRGLVAAHQRRLLAPLLEDQRPWIGLQKIRLYMHVMCISKVPASWNSDSLFFFTEDG